MILARLIKNAPLQILQAALGFATIAAFTRLMAPEEYGAYALILSMSMLAHTLALTWAEAAAFRFHIENPTESARADHFATLRCFVLLFAPIAIAAMFATFLLGDDLRFAVACTIGAAFFRFIARLMRETERAAHATGRFVAAECVYLVLGFATGATLLAFTDLGPAAPFAGLMLAGAIAAARDAPRLFMLARGGKPRHAFTYAAYGAPLALALALDLATQAGLRGVLAHAHGAAALGAFAAAFALARVLDIVFLWFGASAGPLLLSAYAESGSPGARLAAAKAAPPLLLLAAPAACGLALVASPLCDLMVGEGLRASTAEVLPWLAAAALCNGLALHYFSEPFQLARKTALRAALMAAPAALQLLLAIVLAPHFGALGAAIATLVSALVTLATLALVSRQFVALPLPHLARIALATSFMALCVATLPAFGGAQELFIKTGTGVLSYCVACAALDIAGLRSRASALLQLVAPMLRRTIPASE